MAILQKVVLEDTVTNQGDTTTKEGLRSKNKSPELVGERMSMFFPLLTCFQGCPVREKHAS
jgi:hypothetical protein